jgi:uncharacterized membrane protein (DUF4010 family)
MDLDVAGHFLVALLIGALVGIEREKKKDEEAGRTFGGIRTYTLIALVGAAAAWLGELLAMPWILAVTVALVGATVLASYLLVNQALAAAGKDEAPGLTSEIAAVAVCLLGAMVVVGDRAIAVALGVVTSAVLAYKQPLHGWVAKVGMDDLLAAIKLLVASFIVLPLLPDEAVDPWGALNPYKLWLLVILISALSLVGYAAMRWLGTAHGTAITGLAGGLVSSTATTLSFARQSRQARDDAAMAHALATGVLLSWWVMVVRVGVLVAIVHRALLAQVWMPLAAMAVVAALLVAWHYRAGLEHRQDEGSTPPLRNPFSLASAIRFGALFAVVLLMVKIAQQQAPGWVIGVAALAGSVDIDAITLSLAGDARSDDTPGRVPLALAAAVLSNTLVKCGLVLGLGGGALRRHVALGTAAMVVAGGAAAWLGG